MSSYFCTAYFVRLIHSSFYLHLNVCRDAIIGFFIFGYCPQLVRCHNAIITPIFGSFPQISSSMNGGIFTGRPSCMDFFFLIIHGRRSVLIDACCISSILFNKCLSWFIWALCLLYFIYILFLIYGFSQFNLNLNCANLALSKMMIPWLLRS